MTTLALTDVVAGYGQGDVLRGVTLEAPTGEITCVIGPNGAGKSTILKSVSGLLPPRLGSITLAGERIDGLSPRAVLERGIVHVPQERSLFPLMSVRDNVLIGAHILHDSGKARRRLDEVSRRFPLVAERSGDRAGSLSGGQQKIVEIARALMLEPEVILMDEPSMGLDPRSRTIVFGAIAKLNQESGRTILLVEQNARAGLQIADNGIVMDAGVVALSGPASTMLADARVAELYLGAGARA